MRPLRHWLDRRRHAGRYRQLAALLPVQALNRQQLLARQQRDFDDIVRFAAARTDYYARRLGPVLAGHTGPVCPADLPILSRREVVEHMDELLVHGVDRHRVRVGHTGGSTGTPMAFYYDDAKHELMLAGMLRGFMMSGWQPGQKVLYLWGASRDVAAGGVFDGRHGGLLHSEKTLAAFEFSEQRLDAWVGVIRRWRPVLLYGYTSALAELARFVVETGARLPPTLLGVYSTAEVLHAGQRALMQQAFGARVFNQYGCREVPNIAWECRHGGMHVFTDMVHLESMRMDGEDRLLVTSLTNRLMPFIRYDIGDSGRLVDGDCACGLPFPLMEMDMCRHNDMIRAAGGRRVHPAYLNRLLYGQTRIRQYQWVQTAGDRLVLNLVAAEPLAADRLAAMVADLRREVDPRLSLEVRYLDEIPRTPGGKHRFVIGLADDTPTTA